MLYFFKIKIFISLDSCQFVEYLFKIKKYIFQFLNTKKGDNVSFIYFYKIITFEDVKVSVTESFYKILIFFFSPFDFFLGKFIYFR